MLTLNLFYRYRTYKELTSREELRGVIRSVVTDKLLASVLLKLVQNDELECCTAQEALKELYKTKVTIPRPQFVLWSGASEKTTIVVNSYITKLAEVFFPNKLERLKDCAMLLTGSLPVNTPKLTTYLCTLTYIFICVFGCSKVIRKEEKMSIDDITNLTGSNSSDIIGCLNTILSCQDLVSLMYAP
jgi:molybdopterin-binding protein